MRIGAIILAAGQGTRMRTQRAKVLHEVCGRPALAYVLDACREAGVEACVVVVGHDRESVRAAFAADRDLVWVEQTEQRGTGHAVLAARGEVEGRFDHVLVLCGDAPLIRARTLRSLIDRHLEDASAMTLATSVLPDPTGYGRIVRDAGGRLLAIVEDRDCTPQQRDLREANPGCYAFRVEDLFSVLGQVGCDNAKGEYYLTDVLALLVRAGRTVRAIPAVPPEDVYGINARVDLARVNRAMRDRVNAELMDSGVTLVDPSTAWIDPRASIGADTVIEPFVTIRGAARIGRNCRIGPLVELPVDANVADGQSVPARGAAR